MVGPAEGRVEAQAPGLQADRGCRAEGTPLPQHTHGVLSEGKCLSPVSTLISGVTVTVLHPAGLALL